MNYQLSHFKGKAFNYENKLLQNTPAYDGMHCPPKYCSFKKKPLLMLPFQVPDYTGEKMFMIMYIKWSLKIPSAR